MPRNTEGKNALLIRGFVPYKEEKGEEYMNERQLAHFAAILNSWKRELMEEVDRTVSYMQDEAAKLPGSADRARLEAAISPTLRARDRERKLTKQLDQP